MSNKLVSVFTIVALVLSLFPYLGVGSVMANETNNHEDDLILWYTFDETEGNRIRDASGNGNDGTIHGGTSWTDGKQGGAIQLDGIDGHVQLPQGILEGQHDITITAWVNVQNTSYQSRLFDFGSNTDEYMFLTPNGSGGLRFAISTGSWQNEYTVEKGSSLASDQWKHIAFVLSGNVGIIYEDGFEVARNDNILLHPSDLGSTMNNYIGKSQFSPDPYLKGKVDDFRIYSRALDPSEIQSMAISPTEIIDFTIPEQKSSIIIDKQNHTITVPVSYGTDVSDLTPEITILPNASISPQSGVAQDFTSPITYTVTGADGSKQDWLVTVKVFGNPVLPGLYADPEIAVFGDTYYIYPTTDGFEGWSGTQFKVFSSKDLVNWKEHGVILDLETDVSWADKGAWAPAIAERDGVYYFYFSASQSIGVATSTSPTGPFKDALGKPLIEPWAYDAQSIDPAVFIDDDGQAYLYFGQGNLYVAKLDEDMVSLASAPQKITPAQNYNEAAFVFKRNGTYYLTWSADDTRSENYRVYYATGPTPMGPFTMVDSDPILKKNLDLGIKGTGHHSVVKVPNRDEWYIAYHRFAIPDGNGYNREVNLEKMAFNSDGTIQPIEPTLTGITTPRDASLSIATIQRLLEHYESNGDLKEPLFGHLENTLRRAAHQYDEGSITRGIDMLEQFFQSLNNDAMKEYISQEARTILEKDVNALINQWEREVNSARIKALVEQFAEEGEFANLGVARSLAIHMTAVELFENQGAADKVVKHMNSFKLLLDHQKKNDFISDKAYDTLNASADALIKKWQ